MKKALMLLTLVTAGMLLLQLFFLVDVPRLLEEVGDGAGRFDGGHHGARKSFAGVDLSAGEIEQLLADLAMPAEHVRQQRQNGLREWAACRSGITLSRACLAGS